MRLPGTQVVVAGGYDCEPEWLSGQRQVTGVIHKWIPGQNQTTACVVRLDTPITATGDVHGYREQRTGAYLVLELRYAGQGWENTGTVNVELCSEEPASLPWGKRRVGAWVESHATYTFAK